MGIYCVCVAQVRETKSRASIPKKQESIGNRSLCYLDLALIFWRRGGINPQFYLDMRLVKMKQGKWDGEMWERERERVMYIQGVVQAVAAMLEHVLSALCRKKRRCSMSPPPQFADQWYLEVRRPALLLVSATDTQLVQEHTGYYTGEEGRGKWLRAMYVHFDFTPMLERKQNRTWMYLTYCSVSEFVLFLRTWTHTLHGWLHFVSRCTENDSCVRHGRMSCQCHLTVDRCSILKDCVSFYSWSWLMKPTWQKKNLVHH